MTKKLIPTTEKHKIEKQICKIRPTTLKQVWDYSVDKAKGVNKRAYAIYNFTLTLPCMKSLRILRKTKQKTKQRIEEANILPNFKYS